MNGLKIPVISNAINPISTISNMSGLFDSTVRYIKDLYPGKEFIPLHEPLFRGNERKYVNDAIDSTFVSSVGRYVNKFEELICEYTGSQFAIATVNGTAALHVSLMLAGVERNDLVITQALSFIATCNAISYIGANPLFIDVDAEHLGMSIEALASILRHVEVVDGKPIYQPTGQKIGACVPMHTFGFPGKIDQIVEQCERLNIPVVEDAAESLGSLYKGKHTGTFGLLGTYSFNGNKTITCGGGGIIVTNNEDIAKLAKHITTQAKLPHKWAFSHDMVGYNYRCPNLNAALACAQIEQIDEFISNKRNTASLYQKFFDGTEIQFITEPLESRSNYWLNCIFLKDEFSRDEFLQATNDNGVMTRPVWTLLNKLPMYSSCITDGLKNSREIESRLVNIPSSVRV